MKKRKKKYLKKLDKTLQESNRYMALLAWAKCKTEKDFRPDKYDYLDYVKYEPNKRSRN